MQIDIQHYIWSEKYRPKTIKDLILPDDIRKRLKEYIEDNQTQHMLLVGSPGVGKTTTAKVIANEMSADYLYINASDESGIDVIRNKVISFAETRSLTGGIKFVILDECDGLSSVAGTSGRSSAQQALRNVIETYSEHTRFILTANYYNKIMEALRSRCEPFQFTPPFKDCVRRCLEILKSEDITVSEDQKEKLLKLIRHNYPDMRHIINSLQSYSIDGKMEIPDKTEQMQVASTIYKMLLSKETKQSCSDVRKYVIQNESAFSSYHDLLTSLFECVYEDDLDESVKATAMLIISDALKDDNLVMDTEINCYSCILKLKQLFD